MSLVWLKFTVAPLHITFNTYQKSSGNVGTIRTISGSKSHHNSPKMNAFFIRNMTKFEFVISTRLNNSRVAKIKLRCIQIGHVFLVCTGKSLSEGLILGSTNPQYDKRLFINLPVQYMKTTSSEHVVHTNCLLFLFWHSEQFMCTTCSLHVLSL